MILLFACIIAAAPAPAPPPTRNERRKPSEPAPPSPFQTRRISANGRRNFKITRHNERDPPPFQSFKHPHSPHLSLSPSPHERTHPLAYLASLLSRVCAGAFRRALYEQLMECCETGMNSVPDGVVQHILSMLSNVRDVAACACVCRRWRDCVPYLPALFFPRNAFDAAAVGRGAADDAIGRMVASVGRLRELVIYCPFSMERLPAWLAARSATLRVLELRMDAAAEKAAEGGQLDSIGLVANLEELRLWGVSLTAAPAWGRMERLRVLEVVGAPLRDSAVRDAIAACPNLTDLSMLGCDCSGAVALDLHLLVRCRLDILGAGNCSLLITAPRLESLEVHGFTWITLRGHSLRRLSIAKGTGRVHKVDTGKLPDLEYLSLRGVQWNWAAVSSVLQCASEVRHLVMKIEFCGDLDALQPFPEVDLVDFFNSHPKLRKFEIHGAMFAAMCQKNSLKNLDSRFLIPCLEEVLITVRSPLNAEQKLSTLESLVKYSLKLQTMVIRISQMKNCHEAADEFFEEICKFKYMNYKKVRIE